MNEKSAAPYLHLGWDSEFFGFKTARIPAQEQGSEAVSRILSVLRREGYRLVYLSLDINNTKAHEAALRNGGHHVAQNVTYIVDYENMPIPDSGISMGSRSESYPEKEPTDDLIKLALSCGAFSRFRKDPLFPRHLCDELYRTWIVRSTRRDIATDVLIIKDQSKIVGMITLGEKEGRGCIGLFAVDVLFRGNQIGKTLLMDAHRWFMDKGYKLCQVVTQSDNIGACRLYEKCGYRINKTENIFHFWL